MLKHFLYMKASIRTLSTRGTVERRLSLRRPPGHVDVDDPVYEKASILCIADIDGRQAEESRENEMGSHASTLPGRTVDATSHNPIRPLSRSHFSTSWVTALLPFFPTSHTQTLCSSFSITAPRQGKNATRRTCPCRHHCHACDAHQWLQVPQLWPYQKQRGHSGMLLQP